MTFLKTILMTLQFSFQPRIKFLVYSLCRFWLGGIFKVDIFWFNFSAFKWWLLKKFNSYSASRLAIIDPKMSLLTVTYPCIHCNIHFCIWEPLSILYIMFWRVIDWKWPFPICWTCCTEPPITGKLCFFLALTKTIILLVCFWLVLLHDVLYFTPSLRSTHIFYWFSILRKKAVTYIYHTWLMRSI